MATIEQLAKAVLARDAMLTRSLVLSLHRVRHGLVDCPRPDAALEVQAVSAALLDLLSARWGFVAPEWTRLVDGLPSPFYVTSLALRSARERAMCDVDSPAQLRRRNVFAPGEFLTFA